MSVRGAALVLAALVAVPAAGAAELASLPSPTEVRPPGPPPAVPPAPPSPTVVPPGALRAAQRVAVDLDGSGRIRAVRATQRLVVVGTGDYTMGIEAPLRSVVPAAGTESEPGQRRNRILWRGFSAGGRVLAARVDLRVPPAARALPLSVRVERVDGGVRLRLENRTTTRVPTFAGSVGAAQTAPLLDELRSGRPAASGQASVRVDGGIRPRSLPVVAPLRIDGSARLGRGPSRPIEALLEHEPVVVHVEGSGRLRLDLRVRAVAPDLTPPGATTWRAAVRTGTAPAAPVLLERLQLALGATARARQYDAYLPVPLSGQSATVYRYRSVAAHAAPPPADTAEQRSPLVVAAFLAGAVLVAGGALVAWAHL